MTVRRILPITDPMLREKSVAIDHVDEQVRSLVTDMLETMSSSNGAGLAAVQIGVLKRVLVADVLGETPWPQHRVFINPEITWASDEKQAFEGEGCLSMPDIYFKVSRSQAVRVRFLDIERLQHEITVEGFAAVCFQHEMDHLDGVRQIDHVSALKRDKLLKKFAKARRADGYGINLKAFS